MSGLTTAAQRGASQRGTPPAASRARSQASSYAARQRGAVHRDDAKEPCASTSRSGGTPAARSTQSMFCV
jgi:hypothetical protein